MRIVLLLVAVVFMATAPAGLFYCLFVAVPGSYEAHASIAIGLFIGFAGCALLHVCQTSVVYRSVRLRSR